MTINETIQDIIINKIGDAQVIVSNMGGRHFNLTVTTQEFTGKSTLDRHKLIFSAIAPLMSGQSAPIHAIDSLKTVLPTSS